MEVFLFTSKNFGQLHSFLFSLTLPKYSSILKSLILFHVFDKLRNGKMRELEKNIERKIETFTVLPVLLHPKSRGTIRLRSRDPFDQPIIDPNYLDHPDDAETLLTGTENI